MAKQGRYRQSGEQSKKNIHVSENQYTGKKSKSDRSRHVSSRQAEEKRVKSSIEKDGASMNYGKQVSVRNQKNSNGKKICPISKQCGGCQYIDKTYTEQWKIKTDQLKKLLAP